MPDWDIKLRLTAKDKNPEQVIAKILDFVARENGYSVDKMSIVQTVTFPIHNNLKD